ncbi:hypothetical protein FKG94_14615 [Exilibacterium tricleocarpae]|uniref:Uncharacterized protein n=1 Tax=Exilibacterium tricleocarpae TaxID=2591008 RepID=A0A545TK67_9GAMM|nr:hypothetical protein [Exilibacterium tricleocarpae]TQV77605.1 hypothetical protein FKG94_14615 [Exilibacterium tricleocarpae]
MSFQSINQVKEQLIREITNLERQLEHMRVNDDTVNFSMVQTYKEMIHSRREMMAHLPRST